MEYNYDFYPKIYFSYNKINSLDWIESKNYFRKFDQVLDFYIFKCLIYNYYSDKHSYSAQTLISFIIENMNVLIYDMLHIEYFNNFEETIKRYKKLKDVVLSSYNPSDDKKVKFVNFLIFSLDLLQEIIIIFEQNKIYYPKNLYLFIENPSQINFIPIAGGYINNVKIPSCWVSDSCISNYHFMIFVNNGGYNNYSLWSEDGLNWLKNNNLLNPKNWLKIHDTWYINDTCIDKLFNFPVQNISYFEAEACAKYYNGRLPTENEWIWFSTNRNKTIYPWGIRSSFYKTTVTDFSIQKSICDKYDESLFGLNQLYGNVWEYTTNIKKNNKDEIEVCLKGGDWKVPKIVMNNSLSFYIKKNISNYSTGFRIIIL